MLFILRASPRQDKMFNSCPNFGMNFLWSYLSLKAWLFVSALRVLNDYFQMQIATSWLSYAHQEGCFIWNWWLHYLIEELCFKVFQQSHHIAVIKQVSHIFILSYVIFAVKSARRISVWKFSLNIRCNQGKHSNWTGESQFEERPPQVESKKLKVL